MFQINLNFEPINPRILDLITSLILEKNLCKDELLQQAEQCLIRISDKYGSVDIQARGPRCKAFTSGLYAEALYKDLDYKEFSPTGIEVILFIKEGYLDELKIYKQNGLDILENPSKNNLLYVI